MRYRRQIYVASGSKYAAWQRQAAAARAELQAEKPVMDGWTEAERHAYFEQLIRRRQEPINAQ